MLFSCFGGVLGGITIFLLGLKLISTNMNGLVRGRFKKVLYSATKNPFAAAGIGAAVTAVAQSSVAINTVAVSLVDVEAISFYGACALVIGTNVGTTMTAQLVSLSFGKVDIGVIGALFAFLGFLATEVFKRRAAFAGMVALGFGLVFLGIDILTVKIADFYEFSWFRKIFLIDSPVLLLLNGFFITAICQSSSVVSSVLVVLSAGGLLGFENAVFIILGANIGTTVSVIVLSQKKSVTARKVAVFNFLFNLFGSIVFLAVAAVTGGKVVYGIEGASVERSIANFHTLFNVFTGLIVLPLIKPVAALCDALVNADFKTRVFNKNMP